MILQSLTIEAQEFFICEVALGVENEFVRVLVVNLYIMESIQFPLLIVVFGEILK